MAKNKIIGIDIGGTSIKIGFVHIEGQVELKWEISTNLASKGKFIVEEIWESINQKCKENQIDESQLIGIGVGAPGFIDPVTGTVYEAVNIGWQNFELANSLEKVSKLPVYIANDANIAALGELWQGAGMGAKDLILITIGTGVGGGIIANEQIISGANGAAGEIGHLTMDSEGYLCNCGRRGCLETIVSATGIVKQSLSKIKQDQTSDLASYYEKHNAITAKDVFMLAEQGNSDCQKIVQRTGHLLGFAIANLGVVINPTKVLIGGGVSKAGEQLLSVIRNSFKSYALSRTADTCEIEIAQLENDAGIIGAAYFAKQNSCE